MNLIIAVLRPQSKFLPQMVLPSATTRVQTAFLCKPPMWLVDLDCPALDGPYAGWALTVQSWTEGPFKNRC